MINNLKTIVCLGFVTLFLAACSSTGKQNLDAFSRLQNDFKQYRYSSYVTANLKAAAPLKTGAEQSSSQNIAALKKIIRQLPARKKQARRKIESAIVNNGLFRPSAPVNAAQLKQGASLQRVLTLALNKNPDIQTALQTARTSLDKYDQVAYLDDMLAQYAAFTSDITLPGSNQKHKTSVTAGFPFPGLASLKAAIIDQSVESARLQLKQVVQDVLTQTRIAYAELQFAQQEVIINRNLVKLLKNLKDELKNSYSSNLDEKSAKLGGILQADIEIQKTVNKQHIANNRFLQKQAQLNALLNLPGEFTFRGLDKLSHVKLGKNSHSLTINAREKRIEIQRLQSELKKMAQIIRLSKKRFYPDFDAGYSRFNENGGKPGFSDRPKIKRNDFFARNDAYLNEVRQKYRALQAKIHALQIQTEGEIKQALLSYNSEASRFMLYQNKVLPKAKATLDIARDLFETGESSLLDIIDAQEQIQNYQLAQFKAAKEMAISAARIWRLSGERQ